MSASSQNIHAAAPEIVLDFLSRTLPFNGLEAETLKNLASACVIDFFPKGTVIFRQNQTHVLYFYLIQKGGVKIYLKDEDGTVTLKDYCGEGEYFGALSILQGSNMANLNVETVEDTFCFLFPKESFLDLIQSSPKVTHYFLRTMSEELVKTAYAQLRQHKMAPRTESALYLFSARVGDMVKGAPITIAATDSVQMAAARMAELHIGSLLVHDQEEKIVGIITDKDLRTKVVAAGLDFRTPVSRIMATPLKTIPSHQMCFDAMLQMMHLSIHHLAVEQQGAIIGMITTHDIMLLQGTSPLYLFREIVMQRTIEGLYPLTRKIPAVIRTLIEEGAKANNITRMITVLNDHILERLLALLLEELGPPPLPFCWLVMGSEGRREQTFITDQDNALLYGQPENEAQAELAAAYFKTLGEKAIRHLVGCGYPPCLGGIMASNPKWRQPITGWRRYFDHWLERPAPLEVMHSTIFFDFRAAYGDATLAKDLRHYLVRNVPQHELFLLHLAQNALEIRPPLSFFRNLIVEKDGEHKNSLDLKTKGVVPFVDFARLFALKHGIPENNTLGRLRILHEDGHLSPELYSETVKAYEFLMQLRLVHQLRMIEHNQPPDNHINPAEFSELEKQTLKEAFEVVRRLQNHIRQEYRLGEG